jgi:hypothetical protein
MTTTDELPLRHAVERGRRARALLDDPLLTEAFDGLAQALMATWAQTEPGDGAAREMIWVNITVLNKLKEQLTSFINTGRLCDAQLKELKSAAVTAGNMAR